MKCPKCGSEIDTGFNCTNCGYKRYEVAVSKTELTTAEMLLWLGKCGESIEIVHDFGEGVAVGGDTFWGNTIEEAIKQAYDGAKEQK